MPHILARESVENALRAQRPVLEDDHLGGPGVVRRLRLALGERREASIGLLAQAPFVGHALQAHQRAHAGEERHVVHGLGEEVVGTRLQAAHAVGGVGERGHHHHRDIGGRGVRLQAAAHLETVHLRHHHVQQHDVRPLAPGEIEAGGAVVGGDDVEILAGKLRLEEFDVHLDIVDYQYTC